MNGTFVSALPGMDDKGREELAEKLDKDLDKFIAQKQAEKAEKDQNKPPERQQTLDELVEVSM